MTMADGSAQMEPPSSAAEEALIGQAIAEHEMRRP
jgi:hypothetical protein